MAIKRMISRDVEEFRAFQSRMTTVGKIRLGVYNPEGRGRPEKLDRFRLTSPDEQLIRAVAEEYGGTPEQWQPQGGGAKQWQVITDARALHVYAVNGQNIDPVYESWAGGRTCVRRCDGVTELIKQEPCLCNGPDRPAPRDLCKITTRVQVMLQRIPGIGSWLLETHGENAAAELATLGPFIAQAPMAVPGMLRLRPEKRREWNADKGKFDTKDFFVVWLDISAVTSQQVAIGGDAVTQALRSAGAPSAIGGGERQAIEAAPGSVRMHVEVSNPPTAEGITADLRARILAKIEAQTTVEGLADMQAKLKEQGITDGAVIDAWKSKLAGVKARDEARAKAAQIAEATPEQLQDAVDALPVGQRVRLAEILGQEPPFTDPADDMPRMLPFPSKEEMDAAEAAGTLCCGGYRTPDEKWSPCEPCPVMQARQGREALVQRAEAVLPPEKAAELRDIVEGTVEGPTGPVLPMVPDGDYDADDQYTILMTGAGRQTPPLTTQEVNGLICTTLDVNSPQEATGWQLARLIAGLKAGTVPWRA